MCTYIYTHMYIYLCIYTSATGSSGKSVSLETFQFKDENIADNNGVRNLSSDAEISGTCMYVYAYAYTYIYRYICV
jgi:hypothetical protein